MQASRSSDFVPTPRADGLLIQAVGDEAVVYDLTSKDAHCLKPLAAFVFRSCDGTSSLGQIAEVLEDGVTAKLVTPGDSAALADGVASVIMSPDGGAALGQAARKQAEREHSWISRAQAVLEALEKSHDRYASR